MEKMTDAEHIRFLQDKIEAMLKVPPWSVLAEALDEIAGLKSRIRSLEAELKKGYPKPGSGLSLASGPINAPTGQDLENEPGSSV